ncbi:hypothetical protein AVEN_22051-1 [Araneus ventricosus]|uniref:Uncharacterized protein n=1 Tax=Araneus ventricosus TaxID=182803 RepID=A0A4Y2A4F6_ARAVE|nr:hypothetical protein AVEN_22051-1 [Araneus ventricosus]
MEPPALFIPAITHNNRIMWKSQLEAKSKNPAAHRKAKTIGERFMVKRSVQLLWHHLGRPRKKSDLSIALCVYDGIMRNDLHALGRPCQEKIPASSPISWIRPPPRHDINV